MFLLLSIFHYGLLAVVDIFDKFLISRRKFSPYAYTLITVASGLVLALAWPWVFAFPGWAGLFWDLAAGASFALAYYVFFKTLVDGEVSRVVPFIFGLVPLFDLAIGGLVNRNALDLNEAAALCLLIPGALIIAYRKNFAGKHVGLKILAAALMSLHAAVWQYASQHGNFLNHLIWNRVGAVLFFGSFLLFPAARKLLKTSLKPPKARQTSGLFVLKQILGGTAFMLSSYLITTGKISVFSGLQGLRYGILFLAAIVLSHKFSHILDEDISGGVVKQKIAGLVLILAGTLILFLF